MTELARSALERREARPGPAYVLFLAALVLPSVGTCGGIGAYKAELATSKVATTSIDDVADESRTRAGSYVATEAPLRFVSRNELPYDASNVVRAPGATLFGVVGTPGLAVYCEDATCAGLQASGAPVPLRGQVCNGDEYLLCALPDGLKTYLRHEKDLGRPRRVLLAGVTPRANVWEAATGLGIALALLILVVARVIVAGRPRTGGHLSVQRTVTLRGARDAARAALQRRRSASFRLAHEEGDHVVFLAGSEASSALLTGIKSPNDVARRVTITFQEQGAYRATLATIIVTDIIAVRRGVPKTLRPLVQTALEQTLAEVEGVLASEDVQRAGFA